MTLTEEQREAIRAVSDLPRAIGCTRCHNYIQKNYSNQFAVLRSMIDNKDYVPNAAKLIELLAAGEHEQWADWAQSILDSEPGLSEGRKAAWPGMIATPYENLSEELKDKDRREVYLRSGDALAEIERLRAENAWLKSDREFQSEEQAARVQELEGMLSIRTEELEIAHSCTRSEREMHEKELAVFARKINDLEDALVEKQTALMPSAPRCYADARRQAAIEQLQAEGKIGPDAETGNRDHVVGPDQMVPNGKVWQITEERKAAIDRGLQFLEWSYAKNSAHDTKEQIAVLWAMLDEDTHGKP